MGAGCGWTPDYVDGLTLSQVEDQFAYWKENPPAHELLQIVARWKRPLLSGVKDPGAMNPADFARWVQMTGGMKVSPNG